MLVPNGEEWESVERPQEEEEEGEEGEEEVAAREYLVSVIAMPQTLTSVVSMWLQP